jgi:hypothetical protein
MLTRNLGTDNMTTTPTTARTSSSPNRLPSSWVDCAEVVVNVIVGGLGVSVDTLVVVLVVGIVVVEDVVVVCVPSVNVDSVVDVVREF